MFSCQVAAVGQGSAEANITSEDVEQDGNLTNEYRILSYDHLPLEGSIMECCCLSIHHVRTHKSRMEGSANFIFCGNIPR